MNKTRSLNAEKARLTRQRPVVQRKKIVTPSTVVRRPTAPVVPKTIKFYLADPAIPSLTKEILPPSAPAKPAFKVVGYNGAGYALGTVGGQAAGVYVTVVNGINRVNMFSEVPMTRWAATTTLNVIPRAGRQLNAYYDRRTLSFFYDVDTVTHQTFYCADSTDIVSHELGHGILDSFRPELWNMVNMEVWAFHEAFGDFCAMIDSIHYDEEITYLLNQTGGNLRTGNLMSNMAEQFGKVIWDDYGGTSGGLISPNFLRCVYNNFHYADPNTLPDDGPDSILIAEPHSFSRVMSGALYDCFVRIYEANIAAHGKPGAVKVARDTMMRYVLKAIRNAPIASKFYASVANTVLWADYVSPGRPYHDMMYEVFVNKGIITPSVHAQAVADKPQQTSTPKMVRGAEMCDKHHCHHPANPLHQFHCHVPEENAEDLATALHYLHVKGKVSNVDEHTPFEIEDNKIIRSHFACGCGCRQPAKSSPEFTRRYKPQNNAGCGCQSNSNVVEPKKPEVKRGCFTRYKVVK